MISIVEKRRKKVKKKRKKADPGTRDTRRKQRLKDMEKTRERDAKNILFDELGDAERPRIIERSDHERFEGYLHDGYKKSWEIQINEGNVDSTNLSVEDLWNMAKIYKTDPNDLWHIYSQFMNRLDKTTNHSLFEEFPAVVNEILIQMVPELGFLGFNDEICVHPLEPVYGSRLTSSLEKMEPDVGPMIFVNDPSLEKLQLVVYENGDECEKRFLDALLKVGFKKFSNRKEPIQGHLGSNSKLYYHEGYALSGKKLFCFRNIPPCSESETIVDYYELLLRNGFVYLRVESERVLWGYIIIARSYKIYELKLSTFLDSFAMFKGSVPPNEKIFALPHGPDGLIYKGPHDAPNDNDFISWTKMIESNWQPIVAINMPTRLQSSAYNAFTKDGSLTIMEPACFV